MREPVAETPRPRRRWPWVVLFSVLAIAVFPIVALTLYFRTDSVPADRIRPPADLVTLNLGASQAGLPPVSASQTFEEFLAGVPNKSPAALYNKWSEMFISPGAVKLCPLADWVPGSPLSEKQTRWLLEHRKLIDDMIELARLGGVPMIACEQAATFDWMEIERLPYPNYGFIETACLILAAECERRWRSGDDDGAIEHLLAVYPLAQSIREPNLSGFHSALVMQFLADFELRVWLSQRPIPAGVARRLRQAMAENYVSVAQYRRIVETSYLARRNYLLKMLGGSSGDLHYFVTSKLWRERRSLRGQMFPPPRGIFDDFTDMAKYPFRVAHMKVEYKRNAARMLDVCDAQFRGLAHAIDIDQPTPYVAERYEPFEPSFVPHDSLSHLCAKETIALHALNLTALERNLGEPMTETDHYLKRIDETTTTLIYSIGLDYEDQRATIQYDPTNGIYSDGDIAMRVPKK
ncbi:MAG: hypothetical protein ABFD69_01695 [Candidatus Sumerlaeia bacterium]